MLVVNHVWGWPFSDEIYCYLSVYFERLHNIESSEE